jgi:gas vesicle protein
MSSSGSKMIISFGAGLIIGAAAGAVAGVLFAPDKGTETRKKISDKTKSLKNDLSDKIESIRETIESKLSEKNPMNAPDKTTSKAV